MVSENTRVLTWGIPAFAVVAGAVSLEPLVAPSLPRWLLTLGDASYSIYLSHGFVLPALGLLFGSFASPGLWTEGLTIILCLLLSSLVGWGVFIWIESPMLWASDVEAAQSWAQTRLPATQSDHAQIASTTPTATRLAGING